MLISFLHATFLKIGENDSIHEILFVFFEILFVFFILMIYTYKLFIESISSKASVENSSAQWAIFKFLHLSYCVIPKWLVDLLVFFT